MCLCFFSESSRLSVHYNIHGIPNFACKPSPIFQANGAVQVEQQKSCGLQGRHVENEKTSPAPASPRRGVAIPHARPELSYCYAPSRPQMAAHQAAAGGHPGRSNGTAGERAAVLLAGQEIFKKNLKRSRQPEHTLQELYQTGPLDVVQYTTG